MVSMTASGKKQLDRHFDGKQAPLLRIYMTYGWGGPQLRLAQDEPKEDDHRFEAEGYTFLVARDLEAQAGDITIDASFSGIKINSNLSKGRSNCC